MSDVTKNVKVAPVSGTEICTSFPGVIKGEGSIPLIGATGVSNENMTLGKATRVGEGSCVACCTTKFVPTEELRLLTGLRLIGIASATKPVVKTDRQQKRVLFIFRSIGT